MLQQPGAAPLQGAELEVGEVGGEGGAQRAAELVADPAHDVELVVVEGPPAPAPQHGAQLALVVEGHAVVDAVAVSPGHLQDVAALAVGVVDEHVEDRHPPQRRGVLVDQADVAVAVVEGVEDVQVAVGDVAGPDQRHGLLVGVDVLPDLQHPAAVRPLAEPGRRDDVPAGGLGDGVRRDLAVGEGAVGEVPQRPLPGDRLVDHLHPVDLAEERGVGRGHDPAVELEVPGGHRLAAHQRAGRVTPGARAGGSRWPARRGGRRGRWGCRRRGSWDDRRRAPARCA